MKPDISEFYPCPPGKEYYESKASFEEAWNDCPRGDWMLWPADELKVDIRTLTPAKGLCANTVRHLMTDERSVKAVDAAIAFGRGEIGEEELRKYAEAAALAAVDADDALDSAYYAASAAAYAVDIYTLAFNTAMYADNATDKASNDREANQKQTADICREVLTKAVMAKMKNL